MIIRRDRNLDILKSWYP